MYRRLLLVGLATCLSGCLHGAKYTRPGLPVPTAWPEGPASQASTTAASEAVDVKWQQFFTDEKLQTVIQLALANNRDLRVAALNVEKTQAQYQIRRAAQFPEVDATANGDSYRLPTTATVGGFTVPEAVTVRQYSVGLSVGWELDLFGRIRSLKREALEQYLATQQARSAAQISLIAEVATTYLILASDKDNLRLARATFEAQNTSYDLIQRSREAGIASDLDLRQSQSQVEAARVDIARYIGQVAVDKDMLNLLVGTAVPPDLLPSELVSDNEFRDVSAGLPSEVLLRRPDILMAEDQLKAAYANVDAARAELFPKIVLTGSAGFMSDDLTNLFVGEAKTWSFAPQIVMPIFDAGARRANLKAARVDRDVAVAEYEKAIQVGFREVADTLTLRTTLMQQQDAQQALVDALDQTYRLSEARYKAGIDSYLSVLVAQRSLYRSQQDLINLRMARLANLVTFYKVLGGGAS